MPACAHIPKKLAFLWCAFVALILIPAEFFAHWGANMRVHFYYNAPDGRRVLAHSSMFGPECTL